MRSFLVFATLLAAAAPQGDIARIRGWMTAARYDVADSAATALLARAESAVPVDSLAIAHALDLQVEARALGSRGAIEETQAAAELAYRIKDARLPKDDPDRATSLAN